MSKELEERVKGEFADASWSGFLFLVFVLTVVFGAFIQTNAYQIGVNESYTPKERQERAFYVEYILNRVSNGEPIPYFEDDGLVLDRWNSPLPAFRSGVIHLRVKPDEAPVKLVDSVDSNLVDMVERMVRLSDSNGLTKDGESFYDGIVSFYSDPYRVLSLIIIVVVIGLASRKYALPVIIVVCSLISMATLRERGDQFSTEVKLDPLIAAHVAEYVSKRCENRHCGKVVYEDKCLRIVGAKICELSTQQRTRLSTIKEKFDFNIPQAIIRESKFK